MKANGEKLLKKLDMDLFYGFMPAINASDLSWKEFDFEKFDSFRSHCTALISGSNHRDCTPINLEKQEKKEVTLVIYVI